MNNEYQTIFLSKLFKLLGRSFNETNKILTFNVDDIEYHSIVENEDSYSIIVDKVNVLVYKNVTTGFFIKVFKNPFIDNGLNKHGSIEYIHKTKDVKINWIVSK